MSTEKKDFMIMSCNFDLDLRALTVTNFRIYFYRRGNSLANAVITTR